LTQALLILGVSLFLLSIAIAKGFASDKAKFLVADRKLGLWETSLSVAASWIWAPSLFVSAEKAYVDGIIGVFWFIVPNVLCLILFAYAATRARRMSPEGYTLSDFIRERQSSRVQRLYWVTLTGLAVCAFAVQLLAGGKLLAGVMGMSYFWATVTLAAIPLSYSMLFGLKATVATDLAKLLFIYGLGAIIIPAVWSKGGGWPAFTAGLGGASGVSDFWSQESWRIFLSFGLPTTIGLLSGPFGDQTFWQRAFAVKQEHVKSAFVRAALLFAIVPVMMSVLGFIARGAALDITEPQLVNLQAVKALLPPVASFALVLLILAGLVSILDSKMAAMASIGGHDFANFIFGGKSAPFAKVMLSSRLSMVGLTVVALALAQIPNLKIVHLFLFYGTLRSATLLPTVFTLWRVKMPEPGVFYGILGSILLGLPVFAYGNFWGKPLWVVAGSLLTVSGPGLLILIMRIESRRHSR
jgi:Na+/proline symporter